MRLNQSTNFIPRLCFLLTIVLLIPIFGSEFAAQASAPQAEPDIPKNLITPLEPRDEAVVNECVSSFPIPAQSALTYLPLVESSSSTPIDNSPALEAGTPAFKRIDGTVPLGDQLGDFGQFYSQASPSFLSSLRLENQSAITQVIDIALYGDSGYVARQFRGCRLSPQSQYWWSVQDKQMRVARGLNSIEIDTFCEDNGQISENGRVIEPVLHGIYHAEISAENPDAVRMVMLNKTEDQQGLISTYPVLSGAEMGSVAHVPAVLVNRSRENWWDTELVVQNQSEQPIQVQFDICDEFGACFSNNRAVLKAKERRIFLASHLFYSDEISRNSTLDSGVVVNADETEMLTQRAGWYAVTATASPVEAGGDDIGAGGAVPQIALTSQIFKQPIAADAFRPKAELGSSCLLTSSHSRGRKRFEFANGVNRSLLSGASLLRVYNPADEQGVVTISLAGQGNTILGTADYRLTARGSLSLGSEALAERFGGIVAAQTDHIVVESDSDIVAFLWQDGSVVHPAFIVEDTEQDAGQDAAQWPVPFWGAPILPFRWDTGRNSLEESRDGLVSSRFGIGETSPGHELRPEWVQKLNWYNWFAQRDSCNLPVSHTAGADEEYSTYMALWKGLGRCGNGSDRSCYNSEERLQAIQNKIPSSCAGRPLFLSNEPDVNSGDFMSYAELGRTIYIFRDWPGDLYSPTFAGPYYDRPYYPGEATPWCHAVVNSGGCPETPGCEECVRDGIEDGTGDPFDIHLRGLEEFFERPDIWTNGRSWPLETSIDGLSLHFYTDYDSLENDEHWRAPLLQQYRDRATEAGWPIIVKEYGFITWPDPDGAFPELSRCNVANRLDNARRVLQNNLGGYAPEHNQNPFKLIWFHTGCYNPDLAFYDKLCLFDTVDDLSVPVGRRWYEDALAQSDEDTQAVCSEIRMPVIGGPSSLANPNY